jgi:hypothetical protein
LINFILIKDENRKFMVLKHVRRCPLLFVEKQAGSQVKQYRREAVRVMGMILDHITEEVI